MFNKEQFDWVEFYEELAQKLLQFKSDRQKIISIIKEIYSEAEINLPTLELNNNIVDIDPFTIFGLFNKGITIENRIKIMTGFKNKLNIQAKLPKSFDSIPVLDNRNATFYYFSDGREDSDIDNLWNLFESALNYAQNQSEENKKKLCDYFNLTINKKGNANSKITMGLYWIAPNTYLNLDSRNEWYIYESGKLPQTLISTLPKVESKISADTYLEIVEKLKKFVSSNETELVDFKELSFEAWRYSEEVNQQIKEEQQNQSKNTTLQNNNITHYWIYSPGDNASKWEEYYKKGIMGIGWGQIGDLKQYNSKKSIKQELQAKIDPTLSYKNAAHYLWQFTHEMKPGDIVFVKKGLHQIIGKGIVESDYYFDGSAEDNYKNFRKVKWVANGYWTPKNQMVLKTLTDITQYTNYVKELLELVTTDDNSETDEKQQKYGEYKKDNFLNDVYISNEDYERLKRLLENKKNIIIQGAPGVGKTYMAKRLAYSILGEMNEEQVCMIQFHQSYSYEDFIMGYRPKENGFELRTGIFYDFCKEAEKDEENHYYFIIDEINRGNLSKIFGELFVLLEKDKRKDTSIQLLYNNEKFSVPKNVYIIGLMNTADRSLAMLDYALRRRFAFFDMVPAFDSDGFKKYEATIENPNFSNLVNCVKKLNEAITNDESLGSGFRIGHSYFCNLDTNVTNSELSDIVEFELIPLIKEYWFDEQEKANEWIQKLRGSIK